MTMQDIFDRCKKNGSIPSVSWKGKLTKNGEDKVHEGKIVSITIKDYYKGVAVLFKDFSYVHHFYLEDQNDASKKYMKDLKFI